MRTVRTLKPGQNGTKELMTCFGASLLCVRYRYDEDRRENLKTVDLVVQRRPREGEPECRGSRSPETQAGARTRQVALPIGWRERDQQRRVKSAGGRWHLARRVWMLRRDVAERMDLLCLHLETVCRLSTRLAAAMPYEPASEALERCDGIKLSSHHACDVVNEIADYIQLLKVCSFANLSRWN